MTRHKYPHVTSVYGMGKKVREKPYQVNLDGEKEGVSLSSKAVLWILGLLGAWCVFYGAYWLVQTVVDAVRGMG